MDKIEIKRQQLDLSILFGTGDSHLMKVLKEKERHRQIKDLEEEIEFIVMYKRTRGSWP
jgi:hypothetical protein